jgi:hypothetical protein
LIGVRFIPVFLVGWAGGVGGGGGCWFMLLKNIRSYLGVEEIILERENVSCFAEG